MEGTHFFIYDHSEEISALLESSLK